jgi:hypothetical protein
MSLRHAAAFALAALLAAAAAPALRAQDEDSGETAVERALRDQTRVGLRLKSLREKMERLAQRYDDEGRTRNAVLLRSALASLDEQKLLELSDQVERSLEQSNLSTVEQQDALATGLEAVYALLRDRKDADELERQADIARQALAELNNLAANERRLLAATRATSDDKGELTRQAVDEANALQRALESAQSATASLQAADQALGEAELAAQLAAQQRALASEPSPAASVQQLLEQALAMLREKLDQPVEGAGLGDELLAAAEQNRADARRAAAQAAERMSAASEQLARADGGQPAATPTKPSPGAQGGSGESGASKPGDKPAGEPAGGEKPGEAGGAGDKPAGEKSGEMPGEPAGETGDGKSGAEPSGAEPEAKAGESGARGASEPSGEAQPKPKPAGAASSDSPQLAAAKEAMEQAAQELDDVTAALDRSERSLAAARNRARAAALAASQQSERSGQSLEELAERLEAVTPEAGPELLDRTRKLLDELMKAAQAQRADQPQEAASAQSAAQLSLAELLAMLQQQSQSAGDTARPPPTPEALEELAQRQDELQARLHDLMQRLSELPDQAFQEPTGKAGQSMTQASSGLRSGDTAEAGHKEEEASEQLEQAASKLSGAANNYEQLRQDELLFRVGEELKSLLESQERISGETRELDEQAGDAERLTRSQRRTVVRLSDEEKELSTRSETLRGTLEQDGAVAFAFALQSCRDDLAGVSGMLADEQTGEFVQTLQGDVSRKLQDLLVVLDDEVERRRNAKKEEMPPGSQAQQGPPPLVPQVAELLLVQRMEQAALARLDNFIRLNPVDQVDGLGPVERQLLERWALEHVKVTELFESMLPKPGEQPAGPGDGAGQGGGDGAGPGGKEQGQ